MKRYLLIALLLIGCSLAGSAYWLQAHEQRPRWPRPTPPPPASNIFTPSNEPVPSAEEVAEYAQRHPEQLQTEIESALRSRDPRRREMVFTFLLPELIQIEPQRVEDLVARQQPGEARDTLRNEVAQQWVVKDRDAALQWMRGLDEGERYASARAAVASVSIFDPALASVIAEEFDLGRRRSSASANTTN